MPLESTSGRNCTVDDRIDQIVAPYYSAGTPIMTEWGQNFGTTETTGLWNRVIRR